MRKYEKPEIQVTSFEVEEDIALKEYYYTAENGDDSYKVSLFSLSSAE